MDYKSIKKRFKYYENQERKQIKEFYKHYYNFIELYFSRIYGKKKTIKNTKRYY